MPLIKDNELCSTKAKMTMNINELVTRSVFRHKMGMNFTSALFSNE